MSYVVTFPLLTTLVLVPAGTALVVSLVPRSQTRLVQVVGMLGALVAVGLAIAVGVEFQAHIAGYQMVSHQPWIRQFGISWYLGVDGISLFLVLMSVLLFVLALLGARVHSNPKPFVAWMLLLETACLGSFLALDLLLFFVFFELTLVPIYFIIGGWGHGRRNYAAIKFFIYTLLGSAFLFVGILVVAFIHQSQTGVLTFDLVRLQATHLSSATEVSLFLAFTAAFAVKAPVFPLHTWSPDAYAAAPAAGAVVLAGVMAKLGTYGIIRFDLELFPKASVRLAPLLLTLAVIGIIYGGIVAAVQRDLKRLVAYSSLAHLGFIVLGVFALTSQGLSGGVLQMFNHGLYTAALFLLIAMIYERRQTWQVTELRGLLRPAPVMAAVFTVVVLASIGLPGLNGFVGEFLILIGTFLSHRWWAVVATAGVVVAAVYLLWAFQQAFHGKAFGENSRFKELTWREGAVMLPLVALIVLVGIYPRPVLDRISPSVNRLVARVERASGQHQPAVAAARPAIADRRSAGPVSQSAGRASRSIESREAK